MSGSADDSVARPKFKRWIGPTVKATVVLITLVGIHLTLRSAWNDLTHYSLELSPGWLALSGLLYLLGLLPAAWYWHWLLTSFAQPVERWSTIRAHYIGHLGKYVPGKAMVFVIRVGLLPIERGGIPAASLAVFYETMMLMAVGACLAAAILPAWYQITGLPAVVAAGCALATAVATLPPILTRLGGVVRWLKPNWSIAVSLSNITFRHVLMGWAVNLVVWLLLALSFWATLRGILPAEKVPLRELPFDLAVVALAMVAGFASMIPGGAFIREAVLIELLDPRFGSGVAVLAAVVLRGVWLLSELIFSAILYPLGSWIDREKQLSRP